MKRYPEYKKSCVEWIGEIPRHWEMKKIKNTQSDLLGGVWGNEPAENENDIYCIRVADFNYEQLTISTHNLTLRNIPLKEKDKRILKNYDLLVEKSGGGEKSPVGKTVMFNAEVSRQSVTSNFITKFTAKSDSCFPKYVLYCLCFFYHIGLTRKHIKQTTGIQNLDIDSYFQERIPLPSLAEQRQIANFLDHKTEQIDELIRIKERRIELLQEQRTALINQVVTKGLDPNVEMKPSGVEWIGEMPTHWKTEKIKYIATLVSEKSTPETDAIKISPENVESETGKVLDFYSSYDAVGVKFQDGDVLFNKIRVYLNKVVFAKYNGYSLGEMIVIRPTLQRMSKYLFYLMLSNCFIEYCDSISYGAKMPRTAVDDILNVKIPIPLDQEKLQITNFLDHKTQQIDELIAAEHRKIELLKEYRQSLISEAVTGKIDVRNEV